MKVKKLIELVRLYGLEVLLLGLLERLLDGLCKKMVAARVALFEHIARKKEARLQTKKTDEEERAE